MGIFNTLIVVATNGTHGRDMLVESLPKLSARHPVVVVETGPDVSGASVLCSKYENVAYMNTPYSGYDTGAYLWAFWNIPAYRYLFLQDSCTPREPDFVEQFAKALPGEMGAVGWSSFDIGVWDSAIQREATAWMYGGQSKWPTKGIFGPIFYTTQKALSFMQEHRLLPMPPVNKEQQQAMERAWAILFHRAGVRMNFLVDEDMPNGLAMERGTYPALTKTFRMRA